MQRKPIVIIVALLLLLNTITSVYGNQEAASDDASTDESELIMRELLDFAFERKCDRAIPTNPQSRLGRY
jgi:hypothetical protein